MSAGLGRARWIVIAALLAALLLMAVAIGVAVMTSTPAAAPSQGVTAATGVGAPRPSATAEPRPGLVVAPGQADAPTVEEMAMLEALVLFARSPATRTLETVPLDDSIWLGLADQLIVRRTPEELADPRAWGLEASGFRAYVGPFSALGLLANWTSIPEGPPIREASVQVGPYRHCASPPVPAPAEVAELRRLSVQPTGIDSCLMWWTVDLFIGPGGTIEAITLDLWEP